MERQGIFLSHSSIDDLFEDGERARIALDDKSTVYDSDTAVQTIDKRHPNIHQQRQQHRKALAKAPKSKSKQKAESAKHARRKMLEKCARRDEIVAHLAPLTLSASEAAIIAPSHTICLNSGCKPLGRRLAPTPP
jgi:hypothetical protein